MITAETGFIEAREYDEMKNRSLKYLNEDIIRNIDLIDPISRDAADILYAGDDGVLIYERRSHSYMLACENESANKLCAIIPESAHLMSCHCDRAVEIMKIRGLDIFMKCYEAVYLPREAPKLTGKFSINLLGLEDLNFVRKYYHTVDDEKYIKGVIEAGDLFGAYYRGKLIGFAGFHDEGSVGLLEIVPEFRRMGAATELEAFVTAEAIRRGKYPYCQVEEANEKSFALQKKLGYTICEKPMYWLE